MELIAVQRRVSSCDQTHIYAHTDTSTLLQRRIYDTYERYGAHKCVYLGERGALREIVRRPRTQRSVT